MARFASIIDKCKLVFCLLFLLIGGLQAQTYSYQIVLRTSLVATRSANIIATGSAFHLLTWNKVGTVSACSIRVDSSANGVTWNSGDIIAAQTCTSNGQTISTSNIVNYVRVNVTSFTGTGQVAAVLDGYIFNPSPPSGDPNFVSGTADPEGSVTAVAGTVYARNFAGTNGTPPINMGQQLYIKQYGTGNTGWARVITSLMSRTNGAPPLISLWREATGSSDAFLDVWSSVGAQTMGIDGSGKTRAIGYNSLDACLDITLGPFCGNLTTGTVAIQTGNTSVTVTDTNVSVGSLIFLTDASYIDPLCNTTQFLSPKVANVMEATSFDIIVGTVVATARYCINFNIWAPRS